MNIHFDLQKIENLKNRYIILDTNVLSDMSSDPVFYKKLHEVFIKNPLFIDPIVKLEFLRGAYIEKTYDEKSKFLTIEIFYPMIDHQEIYKKVYDSAFDIARIYSHNKKPHVPLGDIFIAARQEVEEEYYFLTEDSEDFPTLLFDRITILTFERINKEGQEYLQHLQLLKFSKTKFTDCLKKLPK